MKDIKDIKITHESPLSIMSQIREYTDYDYALVHLFLRDDIGEEYFNFFVNSLKSGREVILDNSAYELGDSFDTATYRKWVLRLKPTYYILPDCPGNYDMTIHRAEEWLNNIEKYPSLKNLKTIGVVQGSTYEEIVKCYNFWKTRCDKIAFTFYYPFYDNLNYSDNKYESNMWCRRHLLKSLLDEGVIDTSKKHHLLGTWLPQEFTFYRDQKSIFNWIDSIDTSNPILHGIEGEKYSDNGLLHKSSIKMESIIDKPIELDDSIRYNIEKFREFVN